MGRSIINQPLLFFVFYVVQYFRGLRVLSLRLEEGEDQIDHWDHKRGSPNTKFCSIRIDGVKDVWRFVELSIKGVREYQ